MSLIKIENIKVTNVARAVYAARNPMNSWKLSDSDLENDTLGEKDLDLARRLYKAGTEHAKYLRMIRVTFDMTAPLYLLKEMDTYKVGVNCNSTSTMHKIMSKPFDIEDFAHDKMSEEDLHNWFYPFIYHLENLRTLYVNYDDCADIITERYPTKKDVWYSLIQLLPSSYMQKRTYEMSYQALINIIKQRKNHKLEEWHDFCDTMLDECKYLKDIINV